MASLYKSFFYNYYGKNILNTLFFFSPSLTFNFCWIAINCYFWWLPRKYLNCLAQLVPNLLKVTHMENDIFLFRNTEEKGWVNHIPNSSTQGPSIFIHSFLHPSIPLLLLLLWQNWYKMYIFQVCNIKVHVCVPDIVITTMSLVTINHHTIDPLYPFSPLPNPPPLW